VTTPGYRLAPDDLTAHVSALAELADRTSGMVRSATTLAQRTPQLGTAPPALHLADQLRKAAGDTGLTGELTAAHTELNTVHSTLRAGLDRYLHAEEQVVDALRGTGSAAE